MKIFDHKKEVVGVRAVNKLLGGVAGAALVIAFSARLPLIAKMILYGIATILFVILMYRGLKGKTVTALRLKELRDIKASHQKNQTGLAEFLANPQGKDDK